MKNFCLIIFTFIALISCSEEEVDKSDPDLVGAWELFENLNDPGDGSGVFMPVESDKIIVFSLEGTFTSNGDLCNPNINSDSSSSGSYDNEAKTFKVTDCEIFGIDRQYEIEDGNLIISYSCFEGCLEKYRKID